MIYYFLQTSLMLLVAYFLGCWLGCLLRGLIGDKQPVAVGVAEARPAMPAAPAIQPTAFVPPPSGIAIAPRPASATEPSFRRADQLLADEDAAPPAAAAETVRPAPAPAPAHAPMAATPVAPPPAAAASPASTPTPAPMADGPTRSQAVAGPSMSAAAAAAAAAAIAQGRAREASSGRPSPVLPAAGTSSGVSGVAVGGHARPSAANGDDLKRIRGIGPEIEAALHRTGVRRYGEIAGWSASDVDNVSQALGLKGRIEHENWIEQAQVLSKGGETAFSRRYDRGELEVVPAPPGPPPAAVAPPAPAPAATAAAVAAAAAAQRAWTGSSERVRELSGLLSGTAAPASAAPPTAPMPAPAAIGDDLTRIRGIDRDQARALNEHGITRFAQIGSWTSADADRFGSALTLKLGRIQQESWIDQARLLAGMGPLPVPVAPKSDRAEGAGTSWHQRQPDAEWPPSGGQPQPSAAPPPPSAPAPAQHSAVAAAAAAAASALARAGAPAQAPASPAATAPAPAAAHPPQPDPAPAATASGARVVRSGVPDDLKRIKGIGVVLEKRLHGLGIINYGQIAGWSQAEIDKMSEVLDFKGRIERENWIEQARILATGGVTDFARRVDRGEVDMNKPRPAR